MSEKNLLSDKTKYTDFYLNDLDGIYTRLSEYKGKVIFLNFFATWCPPCRNEMPSMQKLHETLKGPNFEMIAVSVDRGGMERVKDFIEKNGYTFKVLLDSDGSAARKYSVSSIPSTFIIDKNGNIVSHVIGERDWASSAAIAEIKKLTQ
ncbi:MAG: TlpA disulfide reductase family protein [Candidatus Margulisiibacteriota bacterium]